MGLFNVDELIGINPDLINAEFIPDVEFFDSRSTLWQRRKKMWSELGIKSEIGREKGLTFQLDGFHQYYGKKDREILEKQVQINFGDNIPWQLKSKLKRKRLKEAGKYEAGTSVFDPVICELVYKWFSKKGSKIFDPFAGGSVRGLLCGILGRYYTGIDLSEKQIEANKEQYKTVSSRYKINNIIEPNWINGDSLNCLDLAKDDYDLIFTCPPYYDLEVYSDKENDLSNLQTYEEFLNIYNTIIKNACSMLKNNSFAVTVVGNIRDMKNNGDYRNFVGDTIEAYKNAGLIYFDEIVLLNVVGTLPVRTPINFNNYRKVGKQHQSVLIFYKGNISDIPSKFPDLEV